MKKTIKAWAMFSRDGEINLASIGRTRNDAKAVATNYGVRSWSGMYSIGYRVRRITITVED